MNPIPVVDLFAGPGGLGEGFSAYTDSDGNPVFDIVLSIEKQQDAHSTLELRSFFRKFPKDKKPEEYYQYLRKEISRKELFESYPKEAGCAKNEAWKAELGNNSSELNMRIDSRIREMKENTPNNCWVLIGGPPCQAYSVVGRSRNKGIKDYSPENDHRSYLYKQYLRIISEHKPALFVMENVKGMLSSKLNGKSVFEKIIDDLQHPSRSKIIPSSEKYEMEYEIYPLTFPQSQNKNKKYKPEDFIIESEKYGIPQARHRVILLGVRKDFTLCKPGSLIENSVVTVHDVIGNLPKLRSGLSREYDSLDTWVKQLIAAADSPWLENGIKNKKFKELQEIVLNVLLEIEKQYLNRGNEFIFCKPEVKSELVWWYIDNNLDGVCNHASRSHMSEDLHRYLYAACFSKYFGYSPIIMEFPEELIPNHKNAKSGHFNDRFRVQLKDKPASTITSHISKDGHYFIHYDPEQSRSLTVREAARLQTFPDNYFFEGSRTQQYIQVGNAVPPLLASKIAEVVYELIVKNIE
ncbi:DNA cytosine methyltransferase [Candidatus Venteria ishoeyi]|uniref:DNA (cytosine-5-)-methyltransferase n=1 Tax=Candidatus Venteria ishoeyi TaxID=1899563 RepID=A0A1H6F5W2_9GAMM|nr:DNA cytosine methyltransferase [Candidatus Venteria ishoeyi]SEH04943.1 Modification methylase BspRI [Candidatus Venteria ishoeyi]